MRQLEAREHTVEQLSQRFASPLFCIDEGGCITEWNPPMERLTGIADTSVTGKLAAGEVFGPHGLLKCATSEDHPDDVTELRQLFLAAIKDQPGPMQAEPDAEDQLLPKDDDEEEQRQSGMELSFWRPGASAKEVTISLTFRYRRSNVSPPRNRVYCFVQDLSLTKALEKALAVQMAAEAAAQAKTRHIAFLCHEIRNPVNGILAAVHSMDELVGETAHPAAMDMNELHDLVRTTLACTDQLRRTVDGILDINKLEEGKLDIKEAPFTIPDILYTIKSQVVRAASEKGLTLETEVDPPELALTEFMGDAGRIQQILANFCWNSVKFTTEGFVRIVVHGEPAEEEDVTNLTWEVIDSGKGMTLETQQKLFQRFAMGEQQVGKYGGSGLGLNICRNLAELLQGRVHCVSTLGKGSTFVLELPLKRTGQICGTVGSASDSRTIAQTTVKPPPATSATPASDVADQQQVGPLIGFQEPWSLRVVREVVHPTSVAVLAEVEIGDVTQQQWGGAQIHDNGIGDALAAATRDAMMNLLQVPFHILKISSPQRLTPELCQSFSDSSAWRSLPSPTEIPTGRQPGATSAAQEQEAGVSDRSCSR